MKAYKVYSDAGHAWVAVKRAELARLGLINHISSFSYQKGQTVYLEEDSDATKFISTFKLIHGEAPAFNVQPQAKGRSPIRSYKPFSVD
jgi:hypothetical protein